MNTNQAGQLLSAGAKGFTVSGGTSEPPPIQPITFGTGPDSLVIEVCDDAYANGDGTSNANGDATFTVSIDGKQIGGTFTTTASHAAGQDQDLTLNGYFGPGTHSVSVNFLNDAYNNTPSTDRNLYVDSVTYKWVNTNQAGQFLSAGAQAFTVSGGTSVNTVTGGPGNDTLNGGVGNDTLTGLGGNDILNGGAGADTMVGGAGNDIYFVDNAADVVNEAAGGGNDDILTKINYVLAAGTEVEGLRANAGATGLTLTGNEFNNILVGNVGNDTLLGGAGNDAINGGVGADTMAGGIGNDTYFVDNAADVVNETAGQGTDTVMASVNYALTAGSEIEFLRANAGASGLSLTGNALVNRLVGGAGNDTLNGGAGNELVGRRCRQRRLQVPGGLRPGHHHRLRRRPGGQPGPDRYQRPWHHRRDLRRQCSYRKRRRRQHDGLVRRQRQLDQTSQRRAGELRCDRLQARLTIWKTSRSPEPEWQVQVISMSAWPGGRIRAYYLGVDLNLCAKACWTDVGDRGGDCMAIPVLLPMRSRAVADCECPVGDRRKVHQLLSRTNS